MKQPHPSLNALYTFVQVSRHRTFKDAARQLHVTPAAVSQQIKVLEAHLGRPLLRRGVRGVQLTELGELILPQLETGFNSIGQAMDLASNAHPPLLKVGVAPAFAAKYLAANLDEFACRRSRFDVLVLAAHELSDYEANGIHIGVRYGRGDYLGLVAERLMSDSVVPVCSPGTLRGKPTLSPVDVLDQSLLHDTSMAFDPSFPDWRAWFVAAGVGALPMTRGPRFNTASDAITAAVAGEGILLARHSLVQTELMSRQLVRATSVELTVPHGFFVVYPADALELSSVREFRAWLHRRFGGTDPAPARNEAWLAPF